MVFVTYRGTSMPDAEENSGTLSQVAEAALLALGPRISWHEFTRVAPSDPRTFRGIAPDGTEYDITPLAGGLLLSFCDPEIGHLPENEAPFRLAHLESEKAKAACERHYVTGKWE